MINTDQEFRILLRRYADHKISQEDYDRLITFVKVNGTDCLEEVMYKDWQYMEMDFPFSELRQEMLYSKIINDPKFKEYYQPVKKSTFFSWRKLSAVAVILLIGFSVFFFKFTDKSAVYINDINPGGNSAKLILANGKILNLNDAAQGVLVNQSGIKVTKTANGQIRYQVKDMDVHKNGAGFNSIETPRGGTYQVTLPDGTNVWLNAASSLKFPVKFSGLVNRKVELNGEAYFEVKKDNAHPFIVATAKQSVEVLGTHFNISSYADDQSVKTTLIEGSVVVKNHLGDRQIEDKVVLKPNQQSVLTGSGHIKVTSVDTESVMDWKNGEFIFEHESLESIMRKISRWYNVDVVYKDETIKTATFSGSVSRYGNLSKVLHRLNLTDEVHFNIEGRKLIVTN